MPSDHSADLDDDPRSRITLVVLEQLCWHMFCCDVIFDAFFESLTWGGRGSNPRPTDYESAALTN